MDIKRETTYKGQKIEGRKRKTKNTKASSNEQKKYIYIEKSRKQT